MPVERRGWVTNVGSGQLRSGDRPQEEPDEQWKAAAFARWHEPDESRGSRPESVRGSGRNSPGLLGMALMRPACQSAASPWINSMGQRFPLTSKLIVAAWRDGATTIIDLAGSLI